jgi:hypothetical protein
VADVRKSEGPFSSKPVEGEESQSCEKTIGNVGPRSVRSLASEVRETENILSSNLTSRVAVIFLIFVENCLASRNGSTSAAKIAVAYCSSLKQSSTHVLRERCTEPYSSITPNDPHTF